MKIHCIPSVVDRSTVARSINVQMYVERVTSRKRKKGVAERGDSGVAGERRVVGIPKFHSWDKYTMQLTNINSDWMSNASSGPELYARVLVDIVIILCIILPSGLLT